MPKKVERKKVSDEKSAVTHFRIDPNQKILVDNFAALQKVMTNLAIKFDGMTNQLSKLLELFEISAKALAEKDTSSDKDKKENQEIIKKLNTLEEQNKIIARGVSLIHEKNESENNFEEEPEITKPQINNLGNQLPSQRFPNQRPLMQESDQYYKSISDRK